MRNNHIFREHMISSYDPKRSKSITITTFLLRYRNYVIRVLLPTNKTLIYSFKQNKQRYGTDNLKIK